MKLKAVVPFGNGDAHYEITPDKGGIFQAVLVRFSGSGTHTPPARVVLTRGVRQWSGSCDNKFILRTLGNFIDDIISNSPIFKDGTTDRKRSSPAP